ncbi:MAG: hypothetical protein KC492_42980, partial [Myxococcales bacterium]|nr:hypothetical protein [Myxococcales bacterium]
LSGKPLGGAMRAPGVFAIILLAIAACATRPSLDVHLDECPSPASYEDDPECIASYVSRLTQLLEIQSHEAVLEPEVFARSVTEPNAVLQEAISKWAAARDQVCSTSGDATLWDNPARTLECKVILTEAQYVFLEYLIEVEQSLR